MPTYEYECSACGHGFEAIQSMMDKKLSKCPKCLKQKLQRLIGSGSGMIFKGSGFYETDYKRKGVKSSDSAQAPVPAAAPKPSSGCGCASGGHSCGS